MSPSLRRLVMVTKLVLVLVLVMVMKLLLVLLRTRKKMTTRTISGGKGRCD